MAKNTKFKNPVFTTHVGVLSFPKLSEVDYGSKDYPDPAGSYKTGFIVKADDPLTQELLAKLRPLHEQAVANGEKAFQALPAQNRKKLGQLKVNDFYTELLDDETEQPTGELEFKFKLPASITAKKGKNEGKTWDNRPVIFDAKAKQLIPGFSFRAREPGETMDDVHVKASPSIWGGTTAKISFEVKVDPETGEPGYFVAGTGACGISTVLRAVQVIVLQSAGERSAKSYGFGDEGDDEDAAGHEDDGSADF